MAFSLSNLIDVAAPAVSGAIGYKAASSASKTGVNAANNATNIATTNSAKMQALYQPYMDAGKTDLNAIQTGLAPGGEFNTPFTGKDLADEPGYQFGLDEGNKAIEAARRSMGTRFSGGAVKEGIKYNEDYAGTKFDQAFQRNRQTQDDRFNRLQSIVNTGANETNQAGNSMELTSQQLQQLEIEKGDAQAAGDLGKANSIQQAIEAGTKAVDNYNTLKTAAGVVSKAAGIGVPAVGIGTGITTGVGSVTTGVGGAVPSIIGVTSGGGTAAGSLGGAATTTGTTGGVGGLATAAGHAITGAVSSASDALGFLGLGSAALPVVGGIIAGGILLAKHYVGAGRKQADKLTGEGGLQRAFESTLSDIDNAPGYSAAQRWQSKNQAYDELEKRVLDFASKGKNQRKVSVQLFDEISHLFGKPNPLKSGSAAAPPAQSGSPNANALAASSGY